MVPALSRKVSLIESSDRNLVADSDALSSYLHFDHIILLGDPGSGKTYTLQEISKIEDESD